MSSGTCLLVILRRRSCSLMGFQPQGGYCQTTSTNSGNENCYKQASLHLAEKLSCSQCKRSSSFSDGNFRLCGSKSTRIANFLCSRQDLQQQHQRARCFSRVFGLNSLKGQASKLNAEAHKCLGEVLALLGPHRARDLSANCLSSRSPHESHQALCHQEWASLAWRDRAAKLCSLIPTFPIYVRQRCPKTTPRAQDGRSTLKTDTSSCASSVNPHYV